MGSDELNAINRQMIEFVNRGELDGAFEFYADNFSFHNPNRPEVRTRADYRRLLENFRASFPDARIEIHETVCQGNSTSGKIVTRYTVSGTAQGEWRGMPPQGQKMTYNGISIARMEDRRFVEAWELNDVVGILQQLGAIDWVTQ